jgi:hypothetical protein
MELTNEEMRVLERLHTDVRNEYEHFSVGFYGADSLELIQAAKLCIKVAYEILWMSGSVIAHGAECKGLRRRFILAMERLTRLERRLSSL